MEPDSLHTLGKYTIRGLLNKATEKFTAHPRIEAVSNKLIAFTSKSDDLASLTIHEFDPNFNRTSLRYWYIILQLNSVDSFFNSSFSRIAKFEGFGFYHDFAVTENYYLFDQAPVDFNPLVQSI